MGLTLLFAGTECPSPLQSRARPLRFVIFDAHAGGVGIAAAAFAQAEAILGAALSLIEECDCDDGCPGCMHDGRCKEFNYGEHAAQSTSGGARVS